MKTAKASRSGDSSRKGWSVLFRHPLDLDPKGNPRRTRRGLGTRDPGQADRLVDQINRLLKEPEYWTLAAKERAVRELGLEPRVVEIFYERAEPPVHDPWKIRDDWIRLLGRDDGYVRVQMIGQFGAGKTTLLRQLIGSDPEHDRFPSISTARTTIFDTEIIQAESPFKAVATFMPREKARLHVNECVLAAISTAAEGLEEKIVLRKLLHHSEQRFRLDYVLGTLRLAEGSQGAELVDDELDSSTSITASPVLDEAQHRLQKVLQGFLDRVLTLGAVLRDRVARELDLEPTRLASSDLDAFQDLLEHELEDDEEAAQLTDDILDEIEDRFEVLTEGKYHFDISDWPTAWTLETNDRESFIRTVRHLSSNHAIEFGRLLTPLVDGLRVSGPFLPKWSNTGKLPKVVLMDGEGLGHTPASSFSLPSAITSRYALADVILLVDSAQQPMPTTSQLVLRSLATTGHEAKLLVVFTHFDQVGGPNLLDIRARENYLLASLENAVNGLGTAFGHEIVRAVYRQLKGRVFFLANIHKSLHERAAYTRKQLNDLLLALERSIVPSAPVDAIPVYDQANLIIGARDSLVEFHRYWSAVLGRVPVEGVRPEHWTRIKALTRRYAYRWKDHYDTLQPVADLVRLLGEKLFTFVARPRTWKPAPPPEGDQQIALARVRQEITLMLETLVRDRLFLERTAEWLLAFEFRGVHSTFRRAGAVREIYEIAAPIPYEAASPEANAFLDLIRQRVKEASAKAGAEIT